MDRLLLCDGLFLYRGQLVVEPLHILLDDEIRHSRRDDEDQPENAAKPAHRCASMGFEAKAGAAVRSAARSRAERARGLRAISAAPGRTGRRASSVKLGA